MKNKIAIITAVCAVLTVVGCTKSTENISTEEPTSIENVSTEEPTSIENVSESNTATNDSEKNNSTEITVTWDEANVTYSGDPAMYDVSSNEMCSPTLIIEGEGVASKSSTSGSIHTENITIPNNADFVSIRVEPTAPTNNCPLDTVKFSITDQNGKTKNYSYEDKYVRGQTGIWYIDVYERP